MASAKQHYPEELNPFGSDEEDLGDNAKENDDYPDHLSPFGGEEAGGLESQPTGDDYDDSLNPFGSERGEEPQVEEEEEEEEVKNSSKPSNSDNKLSLSTNEGNPFGEEEAEDDEGESEKQVETTSKTSYPTISVSKQSSPQPESLDGPPPVPLPRTKSLLKKEQAQKNKQLQTPLVNDSSITNHQANSFLSTTPSTSSSSITTTSAITTTNSFQKKKNKRNAPPVPVNFKRQVSGSLDEIEEELNDIGDKLAIIEKESIQCQEDLKATHQKDDVKFSESKSLFSDLIKRKNVISRRQKELMYRKRELKLDQIHSDIEYELRMIGNKQLSHRTADDETREKELLKKLVEIVEEKSDIVENLNKDTSCDSYDIEEALRRLNVSDTPSSPPPPSSPNPEESESKKTKATLQNAAKNGNCDKVNSAIGNKLSKFATLLPKGGTIKGTLKNKRKRLFKKAESRSIER